MNTAQSFRVRRGSFRVAPTASASVLAAFLLSCGAPFSLAQEGGAPTRAEVTQAKVAANPDAQWPDVMDTGPFISDTFIWYGEAGHIAVLKGIAIKVGGQEQATMIFDTELMRMVAGFDGQVALVGTPWDGKHGGNSATPEARDAYYFGTETGPGWAVEGAWDDTREDLNGPLPDAWAEYQGLYRNGNQVVLSYTVGGVPVLEKPDYAMTGETPVLIRHFDLGATDKDLEILVADPIPDSQPATVDAHGKPIPPKPDAEKKELAEPRKIVHQLFGAPEGVTLNHSAEGGRVTVKIPAGTPATAFKIVYAENEVDPAQLPTPDLKALTKEGGPGIYPETIQVSGLLGEDQKPYAVDTIPLPFDNPWESEIRFGAFDFFSDGKRAACSTWNGDVWIAEGVDGDLANITWKRYASGLYQTLGLKIVDDVVYTQGRDQITRLHDLNQDGEADFYECFNHDVLITEGFHEFTFDLQTDAEGNFWFTKAMPVLAGGRGFAHNTPHNGSILKVSPDGKTLERFAWGLRAPGGIGVGPNGEITTGENEGSYVPRAKITWSKKDSFHGVVPSEWDGRDFVRNLPGTPTDYEKPLMWLPYYVDNSSGSQVWVPENGKWDPLHEGEMLHLSYGKSSIYRVMREEVYGQVQGGAYRLPIDLTCAVMRARFHPENGQLYVIGFRGWQTNGGTGFQRVRYLGPGNPLPQKLNAHENGLIVSFSAPLDQEAAEDPQRYSISKWNYVWGPQYGSGRFSIDKRDPEAEELALREPSKGSQNAVDLVTVRAAKLLEDGKTVFLYIPEMTLAMQMEIKMDLAAADKTPFRETIYNTVHGLRPAFENHGLDLENLPELPTGPIGDPGLIMSMAYGSTDDAVVVDRLALTVPEGTPVTPFMRAKRAFEVVFDGTVFVESRDDLRFRLEGEGTVELRIDGKPIASGPLPVESEPISLAAGSHSIFCSFQSNEKGGGRIQLQWSGEEFVWEPVPAKAFRHISNAVLEGKERTRAGRNLFAAAQCIRCHQPDNAKAFWRDGMMPELEETLPDFENIGSRMHQGWLEAWVRQPEDHCPSLVPDEAPHVAAYLASLKGDVPLPEPKTDEAAVKTGEALVAQLHLEPWIAPLTEEAKLTPGGLRELLLTPAKHHPDTTFPDVRLSEEEADALAAYVLSKQPAVAKTHPGDAAKGKEIVSQRCLVCHDNSGEQSYAVPSLPLGDMWEVDWMQHGCLSEEEGQAPELGLSLENKQALLALRNADSNTGLNSFKVSSPHEYIGRQMKALKCTECHTGDNQLPDISYAGEKLRTEWLGQLFRGEAGRVRPWMETRMPGFASRSDKLAVGLAHAAGELETAPRTEAPDPAPVETGGKIAGLTGYACITCHAAGAQPALQAFEGQGPNFQIAGNRLRESYYHRWMFFPQRIQPATIMPRYTVDKEKAVLDAYYEGNARQQWDAVFAWMRSLQGMDQAGDATKEKSE